MNKIQTFRASKTAAVASIAVLLSAFLMTSSASAAFLAINENTGFGSLNTLTADGDDIFTLVNTNLGGVSNTQTVDTETGSDVSDSNTGDGKTDTGNINVLGGFTNGFNVNSSAYANSWWNQATVSENNTTGASSTNTASATFDNDVTVIQDNDADLSNDIDVDGNSGDNSASMNTGSGMAKTGDVKANTTESNGANSNSFASSGSMMNALFANMARNITTGFSSTSTSTSVIDNDLLAVNINNAAFTNTTDDVLNSGKNFADSNTGDGTVDTGKVEGNASIINDANDNAVAVVIDGADTNSLNTSNDTTGASSTNSATASVLGDVDLINTNNSLFSNTASLDVNSGGNSSSTNTGSGKSETGDGKGVIMIDNGAGALGFFNENTTALQFSSSAFDVMGGNKTTGFMSSNTASSTLTNDVDVINDNNAEVTNDAIIDIVTGENVSDSNTGDGTVKTGDADASTSVTNDLNVNSTSVKWMAMGAMAAGNDTTGASSTNSATVDVDNTLTIVNDNEAKVTTTSTTTSSTGGNSSSFNTGSGLSTTGNSSAVFNVVNNGNGNFNIVQ